MPSIVYGVACYCGGKLGHPNLEGEVSPPNPDVLHPQEF